MEIILTDRSYEKLYNECIEMNKLNDTYKDEDYVGQLSDWLH